MKKMNPGADQEFVSGRHAAHSFTNTLADDALNPCNRYDARADTGFARAMKAFLTWVFA
jgi:hypothetical protein